MIMRFLSALGLGELEELLENGRAQHAQNIEVDAEAKSVSALDSKAVNAKVKAVLDIVFPAKEENFEAIRADFAAKPRTTLLLAKRFAAFSMNELGSEINTGMRQLQLAESKYPAKPQVKYMAKTDLQGAKVAYAKLSETQPLLSDSVHSEQLARLNSDYQALREWRSMQERVAAALSSESLATQLPIPDGSAKMQIK